MSPIRFIAVDFRVKHRSLSIRRISQVSGLQLTAYIPPINQSEPDQELFDFDEKVPVRYEDIRHISAEWTITIAVGRKSMYGDTLG